MSAIDTRSVTVYHSTTSPNAGWWVATVPLSESSFVVRRVLRDPNKTTDLRAVEAAANEAVPEAEGWAPVNGTLRGSL